MERQDTGVKLSDQTSSYLDDAVDKLENARQITYEVITGIVG
jgi:hypothetical protein